MPRHHSQYAALWVCPTSISAASYQLQPCIDVVSLAKQLTSSAAVSLSSLPHLLCPTRSPSRRCVVVASVSSVVPPLPPLSLSGSLPVAFVAHAPPFASLANIRAVAVVRGAVQQAHSRSAVRGVADSSRVSSFVECCVSSLVIVMCLFLRPLRRPPPSSTGVFVCSVSLCSACSCCCCGCRCCCVV